MGFRKSLQVLGSILFRAQAYGVKEDVMADTVMQNLLYLGQMAGDDRAGVAATREHELDYHFLVLDQIVVKVDLLAVLGDELHVGQMRPLDELARRNILEFVSAAVCRFVVGQRLVRPREGGTYSSSREPFPSRHVFHTRYPSFVSS